MYHLYQKLLKLEIGNLYLSYENMNVVYVYMKHNNK